MSTLNHQKTINSLDCTVDDDFFDIKPFLSSIFSSSSSFNSNSFPIGTHQTGMDGQIKPLNNTNWSSQAAAELNYLKASSASSSPQLISFGNASSSLSDSDKLVAEEMVYNRPRTMTRDPLQAQYHVVSERKRREKLSDLFISLSKILPGLKKLDKASLLGDCIKYMKELQERVRCLEEEVKRSSPAPDSSEIISILSIYDSDFSFIQGKLNGPRNETIPEIKVKVAHKDLLIQLQCEKSNGLAARLPSELEKLHLAIKDIRVMPFGCSSVDITILAEMGIKFTMTVKDLIEHLQTVILTPNDMLLNNSIYEGYNHHLSPSSGSEAWQA